jgi:hypothetical protein
MRRLISTGVKQGLKSDESNRVIDNWLSFRVVKSAPSTLTDGFTMSQLTENALTPSRSLTRLGLFFDLMSGKWRPGKFWHQRSFRRKFLLRSLMMPRINSPLHISSQFEYC